MKIVADKTHENMYRVQWPNGDISVNSEDPKPWEKEGIYGFYNKERATELSKKREVKKLKRGDVFKATFNGHK